MACAQGSKALLPVASLWASLDYKSVANWPIMVSRILLLTKLISEINPEIRFQESSLLGKDTSYDTGGSYGTWTHDYTPRRQIRTKVCISLSTFAL